MEKTLLWEAFSSLNATEVREFGKFVRSPFFNGRQQPLVLFDYLDACRRSGQAPQENEAAVLLQKTAGGVKMRQANSMLLSLLEKYLDYTEIQEEGREKIRLAAAYRKRNLGKHFNINLREARQSRDQQPWRHADYFQDLHLIAWERYQFDTLTRRTENFNLQSTSDLMDTAFVGRKLRLACLAASHQTVFNADYQIGLLDAALAFAETKELLETPAVGLYYYCYRFQTDLGNAEGHFEQFRRLLALHSGALPPEELRTLYLLAINFGIKKTNELREGWALATLDLYRGALSLGLLLENGRISRFAFNNIIAIALRVGELDWVEGFILDHKNLLERQWREVAASLGLARVAYARRDHKTALLNLQRSDYKDLINNLTAKTLQLKIYYETGEFEALESHLASMRNYIRRHTSIGYQRTNYSRIVQYTQQLMTLDFKKNEAVNTLRRAIAGEDILTEKEWFLEQLGPV
ncbi:MAG: hypothetical protein SFV22_12080 [Saprospiraceae bacterium]|nr:hypothetical protein [Saprospiraceae bacterium]